MRAECVGNPRRPAALRLRRYRSLRSEKIIWPIGEIFIRPTDHAFPINSGGCIQLQAGAITVLHKNGQIQFGLRKPGPLTIFRQIMPIETTEKDVSASGSQL